MSKTWYPMINYENCIECGACVAHCTHGVYNKEKAPRPIVIFPEGCIQGCAGCGSLCPAEAIDYFGDTGNNQNEGCNCGCGDISENDAKQTEEGCESDCDCGGGCDCGE